MRLTAQSLLLLSALGVQTALSSPDDQQHPLVPPVHRLDGDTVNVLLSLHRALVNVPSISGSEGDAAVLLQRILTNLHYTVALQPLPAPSTSGPQPRYNVLAWPGRNARRTLHGRTLITSHMDVVPPYLPYALNHTRIPRQLPINFTTMWPSTLISGRGSVDAKASVAAQIIAATSLVISGSIPRDSVALLFVVGEETSGDGMKYFSSSLSDTTTTLFEPPTDSSRPQLKSAIFGEPTENLLACGHKGMASATITATGKSGHSGYPWLGRSATSLLIRALNRLLDADLGSSERFGNTTVNVGVVEGGVAANVIASEARAKMAVRVAVGGGEDGAGIVHDRMKRVLLEEGEETEGLGVEFVGRGYGPVECECDVDGFETMIANYGTDVPHLEGDHVSYLYGPGSILVAHGDDEGLTIQDLEDAVDGYKRLIKHAVEA